MGTQEIESLSNNQLVIGLEGYLISERKISHIILLYLREIKKRKLYSDRGFASLFEMLIKHFRQSETSAYQRLKALDLMAAVPEVEERLKNGEVNLSTLAMAQRQINQEEKVTGQKVSCEVKANIVEQIANKTQAQAEVALMKLLPKAATNPAAHERRVSQDAVRLSLTVPNRVKEKLLKLKDLWAHVDPNMEYVEIIERAADLALKKVDPTSARCATESAVSKSATLWSRARSQCEYVDQKSGRRCASQFGLEQDHVIPRAKGGGDDLSNLRLLCRTHNLLMARRHFGAENVECRIQGGAGG
jgi:hypothetical protein